MSAQFTILQAIDLDRENPVMEYRGAMEYGSANAHKWAVSVYRAAAVVALDGATVEGYLLRADGVKVFLTGNAAGNVATLVFPSTCYAVPGRADAVMYIKQAGEVVGVASLQCRIRGDKRAQFVDPGKTVGLVFSVNGTGPDINGNVEIKKVADADKLGGFPPSHYMTADALDPSETVGLEQVHPNINGNWVYAQKSGRVVIINGNISVSEEIPSGQTLLRTPTSLRPKSRGAYGIAYGFKSREASGQIISAKANLNTSGEIYVNWIIDKGQYPAFLFVFFV